MWYRKYVFAARRRKAKKEFAAKLRLETGRIDMIKGPLVAVIVFLAACPGGLLAADLVNEDFDAHPVGHPPPGWRRFLGSRPSAAVVAGGLGAAGKCLRVARSAGGGLVAINVAWPKPQDRLLVEFSFAFSPGAGRSLNVWSHEPRSRDGAQINIAIQTGRLQQYDGRTRTWRSFTDKIKPSPDAKKPIWHRLRIVAGRKTPAIDFYLSAPGSSKLPDKPTATMHAYRGALPFASLSFASGQRIARGSWYLIDDLVVRGGAGAPDVQGKVAPAPAKPKPLTLWTGKPIGPVDKIPDARDISHVTVHQAVKGDHQFLHGASIVHHQGELIVNWANSPVDENSPGEIVRARRSTDGGKTWSKLETVAPGFKGPERHSHGPFLSRGRRLWTFVGRFGKGAKAKRFRGLAGEAFVFDEKTRRWGSRGVVIADLWPCCEPIRLSDGNWLQTGMDRDGYPGVAISRGDDLTQWKTIKIPVPPDIRGRISYGETTAWADGRNLTAVIRGRTGRALISTSDDSGKTWTPARDSDYPMAAAKPYAGVLSTKQRYLITNMTNRNTLVIAVSQPAAKTLCRIWRIRHGRSRQPLYRGRAKSPQWSYPYACEHDGKLYVVYSIGVKGRSK